ELLGLVNHLILSRDFAEQLTGIADPRYAAVALWVEGKDVVVVTYGTEGCWTVSDERSSLARHFPAYPVATVDTTGCGDVFHGAYAAALAKGHDLAHRLRFASAAAALKATRPGGQAGIPNREAVEAFLAGQSR